MNVNRQNNCYSGRSGRPSAVVNRGCCNAVPVQTASCCNNAVAGNIIVGGCAEAACNKETARLPWLMYRGRTTEIFMHSRRRYVTEPCLRN